MVLIIDNYDSFSYNLYQLIGSMNPDVKVIRNDKITLSMIDELQPTHIIISPGPGKPKNAGLCEYIISSFSTKIPILGVCLGHQAICEVYGAEITYAKNLMHGKASEITLNVKSPIFKGLPQKITAARYHSLAANPSTIPSTINVCAQTNEGEIMAVEHINHAVYGVQFHPESVLTPKGGIILSNFLKIQKSKINS
jgi:anthranilate synthase component 2